MPPLQNRVDPFGALHSVAARGSLMGNRGGRFHRPGRTLGARRWASRQWICCVCALKGRKRAVWGERTYTELFFLDEVTALACGHRPCFECRWMDAQAFRSRFGDGLATAGAMDRVLHAQRLAGPHDAGFAGLPDLAMIAHDGEAFVLLGDAMLPWSFAGYGAAKARPAGGTAKVLTPRAIVEVLARGYAPGWHHNARDENQMSSQTATAVSSSATPPA